MILLSLGLHPGFTISYPDPKAPMKAHLSVDGCRIIIVEKGMHEGDITDLNLFKMIEA